MLIDPGFKDSDGDGFSDIEEEYGIVTSGGRKIQTNPETKHSDNDGLADNEEIDVDKSAEEVIIKGKKVWKAYHHMKSDPTKGDTDGDGYFDKIDPRPKDSDVTITKLKSEYILIDEDGDNKDISFGGFQGWFTKKSGTDEDDIIVNQGCGLIAMCDTILYLAKTNPKYNTSRTNEVKNIDSIISFEDYVNFVNEFNKDYAHLKMCDLIIMGRTVKRIIRIQ